MPRPFKSPVPPASRWPILVGLLLLAVAQNAVAEERNAYAVKNAFREVVRDAVQSTVHVMADKKRVALGAIVEPDGYVLTKASELHGDLECQLFDGQILKADLVGADEQWDLALLKIAAEGLPTVTWSDGDAPPVGSWLATPGLETIPISIGVVSVAPRKIERRLPALGVILEDGDGGPRVNRVVEGSGAGEAGVKAGDIVTALNGQAVTSRDALIDAIRALRPGDRIRLGIRRGQETLTLEALLGEMNQLVHGDRDDFQNMLGGLLSERRAGFPLALQHDTVLRPSQCGGPLVDLDGRVVGLNIARASRVGSYAIPASAIKPLLKDMKAGKLVTATSAN